MTELRNIAGHLISVHCMHSYGYTGCGHSSMLPVSSLRGRFKTVEEVRLAARCAVAGRSQPTKLGSSLRKGSSGVEGDHVSTFWGFLQVF